MINFFKKRQNQLNMIFLFLVFIIVYLMLNGALLEQIAQYFFQVLKSLINELSRKSVTNFNLVWLRI